MGLKSAPGSADANPGPAPAATDPAERGARGLSGRSGRGNLNAFINERVQKGLEMTKRDRTEAAVLAEAGRLFALRGFAATSVRDIAAAAGVSVGTVVSVGGKSELFLRCMEELATADARRALGSQDDARAGLRAFVTSAPGLTERGGDLSRDYLAALLASPPSPGNAERLDAVVADLTARWADRLGLAPDDPGAALAARSFYLCFVGCVFSVACGQMTRADAVGLLLALIDDRDGTESAGARR